MPDITSAIEEVYMDITWGLSLYDQEIYPLNTSMWTWFNKRILDEHTPNHIKQLPW